MTPKLNSTIVENDSSVDDSIFASDVEDESESEEDIDNDDDVLLETDDDGDHDDDESFDNGNDYNSVDNDYLFLNKKYKVDNDNDEEHAVDTYVDPYTNATTATNAKTSTGSTTIRSYLPSISIGNSNINNNDDVTVVCKNCSHPQLPKNTFVSKTKLAKSDNILYSSLSRKVPKSPVSLSFVPSVSSSFSNMQNVCIIIIVLLGCYGCISTYCSLITEQTILQNEIQIQQTIINNIQQQYMISTKENIQLQQQLVNEMEQVNVCNKRTILLIKNYDTSKKDLQQKHVHSIHTIQYEHVVQKSILLTIINFIYSTWKEHYQKIIIDNDHLYRMLHMSTLTIGTSNDHDDSIMLDDDNTIDLNINYDNNNEDDWNQYTMYPTTIDYKHQLQQTLMYIQRLKNKNYNNDKYNWMTDVENDSVNNDDRATTSTRTTFRSTSTRNNNNNNNNNNNTHNNNNNKLLLLEWGCWYLHTVTHHKYSSNNQLQLQDNNMKQIIISAGGLSFLSHVFENYYYADHVNNSNNNNNNYFKQKEIYFHTMALKTIQKLTISKNTKGQQQQGQELIVDPLSKTELQRVADVVAEYINVQWETIHSKQFLDIVYSILMNVWKWVTYTNGIVYSNSLKVRLCLNTLVDSSWKLATDTMTTLNDIVNSTWYNNHNYIDIISNTWYNNIGNYFF